MIDDVLTRAWRAEVEHRYTERDSMLYALGLGVGADPLDPVQLRFVYEKELQALPTMAAILASPGFWMRERHELGIDAARLLHGEQSVELHGTLQPSATLRGVTQVTHVVDKGLDKGAALHVSKELYDARSEERVATTRSVYFLRGDGGFSRQPGARSDVSPPSLPALPDTPPALHIDLPTRPDQALIYQLCGDANPLHVDVGVASRAGFPRPILHGLATWGIAGWGLLRTFGEGDARSLRSLSARFSSPVFPGETVRLECWPLNKCTAFRAKVLERDLLVLNHGWAHWR